MVLRFPASIGQTHGLQAGRLGGTHITIVELLSLIPWGTLVHLMVLILCQVTMEQYFIEDWQLITMVIFDCTVGKRRGKLGLSLGKPFRHLAIFILLVGPTVCAVMLLVLEGNVLVSQGTRWKIVLIGLMGVNPNLISLVTKMSLALCCYPMLNFTLRLWVHPNYTFDQCWDLCLQLCNCKAFQYSFKKDTGFSTCYLKTLLLNGYQLPSFSGDLFLKVPQNNILSYAKPIEEFNLNCSSKVQWLCLYCIYFYLIEEIILCIPSKTHHHVWWK